MIITHSLDKDWTTGKHLIFEVDFDNETFESNEKKLATVDTYEEAIQFIKTLAKGIGNVYLMELPNHCWLHIDKDGDVAQYDFEYGVDYKLLSKWSGKEYKGDEVHCTSCGDGGCVWCEPHRFIEGYKY